VLDETIEAAAKWKKEREDFQLHLFGFEEKSNMQETWPEVRPFDAATKLEYERELLGVYLSGHPLDAYRELADHLQATPIHHLSELPDKDKVVLVGRIIALKKIVSRAGKQMAFLEVEDRFDKIEVVVFPEVFKRTLHLLEKGQLLGFQCTVQQQDEVTKCLADQIVPLDEHAITALGTPSKPKTPPHVTAQKVYIKVEATKETTKLLNELKALLNQHQGQQEVVLFYERTNKIIVLSDAFKVKPSIQLTRGVEQLFGIGSIKVK
jgi:DNA polymerase-3 subunit alpha